MLLSIYVKIGSYCLFIYTDAPSYDGGSKIKDYNVQMKGAGDEGRLKNPLKIFATE